MSSDPAIIARLERIEQLLLALAEGGEPKRRRRGKLVKPAIEASEHDQSQAVARFGLCDTRKA